MADLLEAGLLAARRYFGGEKGPGRLDPGDKIADDTLGTPVRGSCIDQRCPARKEKPQDVFDFSTLAR